MAKVVAPTDATVLIEGESGVGKEIFVQAIRMVSGSRSQPFVSVNCSAIPESLIESELFGYSSGSFTGASKSGKVGKFEIAHGGTIFSMKLVKCHCLCNLNYYESFSREKYKNRI